MPLIVRGGVEFAFCILEDWGLVTAGVTESDDWGLVTGGVIDTDDWNPLT